MIGRERGINKSMNFSKKNLKFAVFYVLSPLSALNVKIVELHFLEIGLSRGKEICDTFIEGFEALLTINK